MSAARAIAFAATLKRWPLLLPALALVLTACAGRPPKAPAPPATQLACPEPPATVTKTPPPIPLPIPAPTSAPLPLSAANNLKPANYSDISGWPDDGLAEAFAALLRSCMVLKTKPDWQRACGEAAALTAYDPASLKQFFEQQFVPYAVVNADGTTEGMVTGYYEPILRGNRRQSAQFRFPVYGVPDDLLVVDLSDTYPELKNMRLRGRVEGRRIVPYYTRAEIESGKAATNGRELLWVDDPIDLFFLQIQGSGKVMLESGELVRVSYADQNGYPYKSIGRALIERGELTLEQASAQGIKAWALRNPDKLNELLNVNSSYVFFREQPVSGPGPNGALGAPLTAQRSVAVDARVIPLGVPVFLNTTWPGTQQPLARLMVAQDTGGAIRGAVRADFYWGTGEEAGQLAGRMRQSGRMWVLLPLGFPLLP